MSPPLLVLLRPAANRVYAAESDTLAAAELEVLLGGTTVTPRSLAGVDYLAVEGDATPETLGTLSAFFAAFRERPDGALEPLPVLRPDRFDDDLVGIPKYAGKTNEQFTRLLTNLTLSRLRRPAGPWSVLDPLCGRGTTLSTALTLGHHGFGVEADVAAVEAYATFLRTYLRRKRLKHSLEVRPLRREGRTLGKRLAGQVTPAGGGPALELGVLTGDTRDAAALWGRRRFDAVVADAPYGVVHGSRVGGPDGPGQRRSAADLLAEAVPVWAGQLKQGGALGLSWNTYNLDRDDLLALLVDAGLEPCVGGPWERFGHRVDSAIRRDVVVAIRPGPAD